MTVKNDRKFEEELTCQFKINISNLTNFDRSTQKSQKICVIIGCFRPKASIMELYVFQCLFVKESNKKQRRGRIISNSTKAETFSSFMTTKCS